MISQKPEIVETISQHVDLKKKGRNHVGLCPFHEEKTPSFTICPKRQRYMCFGCGESGDVLDFIQKKLNCNFKEALIHLNINDNENKNQVFKKPLRKIQYHRIVHSSIVKLLGNFSSPFHKFCRGHLGISDDHLKNWYVGTKNNTTIFGLKENGVDKDFHHAHYINYQSNGKRQKNKSWWHKTDGVDHEKCLYGLSDVTPIAEATIIVEAPKSAVIASYFYGGYNWVSTVGSNTLTHPHYYERLFEKLEGSNMIIYYLADADDAGKKNKCIEAILKAADKYHIEVIFTSPFDEYGKGYDIADAIIEGNISGGFDELLRNSKYHFYPKEENNDKPTLVPRFPTHIFPREIEQYIRETAASLPCPTDFIGGFVLSVLASAIGNTRKVKLKEGWEEQASLYLTIVAPPSSKKSPALAKATKPIKNRQRQSKQDYDRELEAFKEDNDDGTSEPTMRLYYTSDATIESLISTLQNNPRGVIYIQDEMTAWLNGMNQYKSKGNDKQYWLSFWSASDITVTRKSLKFPLVVSNPHINLIGGIQPDCVKQLKGTVEDGFINRILFIYPPTVKSVWTDKVVSQSATEAYHNLYDELSNLGYNEHSEYNHQPSCLKLSSQAKNLFIGFVNKNATEIENSSSSIIKATFSKLEAYTARFALILQLAANSKSSAIEEIAMKHAIELTSYFKAHIRKTYRLFTPSEIKHKYEKAVTKIRERGGEISVRDICTYKINGCKNKSTAMELIKTLEKNHLGEISKRTPPNGGRKSIIFKLH